MRDTDSSAGMTVALVVPGSSERMLAKAPGLAADELVLDLEDAVRAEVKDAARGLVAAALPTLDRRVAVRVNEVGSPHLVPDVLALVAAGVRSLVVPKVEDRDEVVFLDRLLSGLGSDARLQLLVETAAGIRRLDSLLAASPRVEAVVLGYADLAASLGAHPYDARDAAAWTPYQTAVVSAARAAGVRPVDGPWLALDDEGGLAAAVGRGRALGFTGTWTIHPAQGAAALAAYAPTPDEVARAEQVLAALVASADGALRGQGQMLDEAVAKQARDVLARVRA